VLFFLYQTVLLIRIRINRIRMFGIGNESLNKSYNYDHDGL
jgi:hypothetical protein